MRIKRLLAGMMVCLMLSGCAATTAFAYTGEDTDAAATTEATSETETEATIDRSGSVSALESESEAATVSGENTDTAGTAGDTSAGSSYNMTVEEDGTITFTYGGQEYSINPSDLSDTTSTGTVVNVGDGSYLNLRTGSGTDNEVIGHLLPGTQVEVTGEENGWYKVTVSEQTGYVYSDYLDVTEATETSDNSELLTALLSMMAQGLNRTDTTSTGLTPDGNLTLVDDIGSTTESGQQFITLVTKAGNTFYLVIDRDDDGDENVHFLNLVDEADLFALLDEDAQAAYESEQTEENTDETATSSESEETADPDGTEETETTEKNSISWAPLMLLVLVMIGGIGGFLYVTITKKRKQVEAAKPDPDADYEDEDGEEYELPEDTDEDEADDDSQIYSNDTDSENDMMEPDVEDNEPV